MVVLSLDGKYNELKKAGGNSKVANSAFSRCQDVERNPPNFISATDVAEYINPRGTAIAYEREKSRAVNRLSILRNLLTLIPLTITWWGFLSISQEKDLDLTKALATLTPVATADIVFFILLIFVGLLADARTNAARQGALRVQEILDSIVHELTRQVAQRPQADPGNIKQWAQLVQQQLDAVRDVLRDVSTEIKQTSTTTQAVANQMQTLQGEVTNLARVTQTLGGAVAGIAGSSAQMAKSAQAMEISSKDLTKATVASVAAQDQTNQHLKQVTTDMNTASGAMNKAATEEGKIPAKLDQIDGSLQRATKNLADTTKMIKDVETRLANIVRASGGVHSIWWRLAPWHWGKGGPQVSNASQPLSQQQQWQQWQQWQQQQQRATPPPGQLLPNTQNMPGNPNNPNQPVP